jgi:hypothetical protein
VTGDLETPPTYQDFSCREYLARQHVYSIVSWPRIELLETGQGSPFWSSLYALKTRAVATIAHLLPEPQAALLTGILLGVETGIPKGLYQQFNATGTSHGLSHFTDAAGSTGDGQSSTTFAGRDGSPVSITGLALAPDVSLWVGTPIGAYHYAPAE